MNITILGGKGLLGSAIAREMAARGHEVTIAARRGGDIDVDLRFDANEDAMRRVVAGADIVVNAAGILIEREGNSFDLVHTQAAQALALACAAERVARIVHISALGVGTGIPGKYMASKLAAERSFQEGATDYVIVRPGLLVDDACPSTRLFKWLAKMPVIVLPGLFKPGSSLVAPVRVDEVARHVAAFAERPKALRRVVELAGLEVMSYREMLARYRAQAGQGTALWVPVPWWVMKVSAWAAVVLPQKVFSLDTVRLLQAGCIARRGNVKQHALAQ